MPDTKPSLLFLCHRIPYPPNKGDKIRSWHLLKHLQKTYNIFLGTFIDDENDWQYVDRVESICEESYFVRLRPRYARAKSLSGLLTGQALSVPYYYNQQLQDWVKNIVVKQGIKRVVVYSSAMAQYVLDTSLPLEKKIVDFVDVDSDKWQQYADKVRWPLSLVYRREAKKLLAFDRKIAKQFDHSLFVSIPEANLFRQLSPETADKTASYNNGVDSEYFSPYHNYDNPYDAEEMPIVFTGAMDYWPNADAVNWFVEEIFPKLKDMHPRAVFCIVGSNPTAEVMRLATVAGVKVTGRVEDVRPYIHHATLAVAPMRIARGIQNKVLEAMAMKKVVVVTPLGIDGIQAIDGRELLLAGTADSFFEHVEQALEASSLGEAANANLAIGEAARQRVLADFNWDQNLQLLDQWLESETTPRQTFCKGRGL